MTALPVVQMTDNGHEHPAVTITLPPVTGLGFLGIRLAWTEQMAAVESGLRAAESQWMREHAAEHPELFT